MFVTLIPSLPPENIDEAEWNEGVRRRAGLPDLQSLLLL